MLNPVTEFLGRLPIQSYLVLPLVLALWIGWQDLKTRRIPNYLTLGVALSGLAFQLANYGWSGLSNGALGLVVGFSLLFLPYVLGGLGAGDVKALAALGAWLGPPLVLYLFFYMTICGAVIALGTLCWKGRMRSRIVMGKAALVNWALCRFHGLRPEPLTASSQTSSETIPYGTALALGMVMTFINGA
jgi:prepilin peptidase CpaA